MIAVRTRHKYKMTHTRRVMQQREDCVATDHVDPDFDDFESAELDIREQFGHLADND